ncbi:MAG: Asp-tRNA(Asn)/Glu-tRNA(Gln) amidotransferase subunit GatB [Nanoarchaeota archaeon]
MKSSLIVGLEIHGYIETKEKLFCDCRNFHDMKQIKPNVNVCPICTGQPGSKPMLTNKSAVEKILQIALMLNCKIDLNNNLVFQRKHYDWPDMPSGYQRTISGAYSNHVGENGKFLGIRIKEIHLEEDPGAWDPETGNVDYNRAGAPLVEIVTEPDFESAEQLADWMKKLILTLSYIKVLNKDAGIKADVNVSIKNLSERAEIKNINSISEIKKVIDYEYERHKKEKPIKMETRRWNSSENKTELMRTKERAADYRFIPDPDLPIIKIEKSRLNLLKNNLPETPMEKLDKIVKKYKIEKKDAEILIKNLDIAELYEEVIKEIDAKFALQWIIGEWFSVLNYNKKSMDDVKVNSEHFIDLLDLLKREIITPLKAKDILRKFIPNSFSPLEEAKNSGKIDSYKELKKIIEEVLERNKKSLDDYKNGENKALNFLIGQVMNATQKRADYQAIKKIIEELI